MFGLYKLPTDPPVLFSVGKNDDFADSERRGGSTMRFAEDVGALIDP
jgi:hypothetical protein